MHAKPDPLKFARPYLYATHFYPRASTFKTHPSLGHAKASISQSPGHEQNGTLVADAYVYAWDHELDEWVELHHIPKGSKWADHPFVQAKHSTKATIKGPSDAQVSKAIASITSVLLERSDG